MKLFQNATRYSIGRLNNFLLAFMKDPREAKQLMHGELYDKGIFYRDEEEQYRLVGEILARALYPYYANALCLTLKPVNSVDVLHLSLHLLSFSFLT